MVNLWFMFSLIWSIGASVDEPGRKALDTYLREQEGSFPNKDSIYEYFVDVKQGTWVNFEDKLEKSWRYPPNAPFRRAPSTKSSYQQSILFDTIHLFRLF